MIERLGVVGLGLVGGSVGLAASSRRVAARRVGVDIDAEVARKAVEAGAVDEAGTDLAALAACDLVVVAVPIPAFGDVFRRLAEVGACGVVTDVGSVKAPVLAAARAALGEVAFVGSHPMTGSERGGIEAASEILFESAVVAVTPDGAPREAVERVADFWRALGGVPVRMDAASHDRIVAAVSHLPYVVAALLVVRVAEVARAAGRPDGEVAWSLCAGGFRDTTRIASSPPPLWREILAANRAEAVAALDALAGDLRRVRDALAEGDDAAVEAVLAEAAAGREKIPERGEGLLPGLATLRCSLPDRPGALAEVTGALGRAGINIVDFALERVREVEGRTPLRLAFADEPTRAAAKKTLADLGYEVA